MTSVAPKDIDKIYYKKHKLRFYKSVMYPLQALGAFPLVVLFRLFPLDFASFIGGKLARMIGPHLKEHKVALMNLEMAFPDKSETERKNIIMEEWENIGRLLGEYPHMGRKQIFLNRITVEGIENVKEAQNHGKGVIFVSLHMGNWELLCPTAAAIGLKLNSIYRKPNNPYVDNIFRMRNKENQGQLIPKNNHSGFKIMRLLARKENIAMMVDQKLNEGIELDFFGRKAMTTPAPAVMTLRYGAPIVAGKCERLKGAHFKITFTPPICFEKREHTDTDIKEISQLLNDLIEAWIKENPSQWLWIHKRWNKDVFAKDENKAD